MKQKQNPRLISQVKKTVVVITGSILLLVMGSFTVQKKIAEDFLQQLGMTKNDVNAKISHSMLEGYLDASGVKNIKNIVSGKRSAIAKDLLAYCRQYVNSPAFVKEYKLLREEKKPIMPHVQTPEEMQRGIVDLAKQSIADLEKKIKTADAQMKPVFEKTLESVRKQLQQAEDPANRSVAGYRNGYPALVKNRDISFANELAKWEAKYPADPQHFIRIRLERFMEETKDIDFDASLQEKKGIKYFTNPLYEQKPYYWKMGFRAGKDVVEPTRTTVGEWILSIH